MKHDLSSRRINSKSKESPPIDETVKSQVDSNPQIAPKKKKKKTKNKKIEQH
jgi:hypothetical protein